MYKKNGFTLVELLGVIVVLAILALITIPIISNVVNNVRIKSLENSAYGLIEAGNLYYAQYGNNSNLRFNIKDNQVSSSDTDRLLTYKGTVKSGTVILDRKGQVTVCITDGKNSAYKNYNEEKVTTVKGKTCNIREGSSIVYLDDEATIDFLDNTQLTNELTDVKERLSNLENSFLDKTYPVGSIYLTMTEDTVSKVKAKFGGTWEQIESGRMLQSTTTTSGQIGGNSTYSYTPEGTVGDTTLTVNQIPAHKHNSVINANSGGNAPSNWTMKTDYVHTGYGTANAGTFPTGGSQPHTHSFTGTTENIKTVPPYITVYMYKRTA